jgi:hypothetical protein
MNDHNVVDWEQRDPLGAVLHSLKLSGVFYCRSELRAPWGLTMPPMPDCLCFHTVVSGGWPTLRARIWSRPSRR